MSETTNSILRVGEGSSVLEIRVGVPHLTKFDVGGVRRWTGGSTLGVALMRSLSTGIDAPASKRNLSGSECPKIDATALHGHS